MHGEDWTGIAIMPSACLMPAAEYAKWGCACKEVGVQGVQQYRNTQHCVLPSLHLPQYNISGLACPSPSRLVLVLVKYLHIQLRTYPLECIQSLPDEFLSVHEYKGGLQVS